MPIISCIIFFGTILLLAVFFVVKMMYVYKKIDDETFYFYTCKDGQLYRKHRDDNEYSLFIKRARLQEHSDKNVEMVYPYISMELSQEELEILNENKQVVIAGKIYRKTDWTDNEMNNAPILEYIAPFRP